MPNQIERDVYVLSERIKNPIEYVRATNTIPIIFHFRDYTIPSGATALVYVRKPSGLAVYNSAEISGNSVTVDVTTQMFIEEGFHYLQIQIANGEDDLVTFDQPVQVYKNRTDPDAAESENESSLFEELQEAAQEATDAASSANAAATSATQAASEAQQAAGEIEAGMDAIVEEVKTDLDMDTYLKKTGDASDTTVTFTEPTTEEDLASGDSAGTLFGKIKKKLSTLKTNLGVLSSLTTTDKSSLVAAVNELNGKRLRSYTPVMPLTTIEPGQSVTVDTGRNYTYIEVNLFSYPSGARGTVVLPYGDSVIPAPSHPSNLIGVKHIDSQLTIINHHTANIAISTVYGIEFTA